MQRLRQGATFGFEVVRAPKHHGHSFGKAFAVFGVTGQEFVCLNNTISQGKGRGQTEGINAVQIAAGGQDVGVAHQVAAGRRLNVAAI